MNRIWTALLTVALGLAGCGGDSPTGNQNPAPPAAQPNDITIVPGASQLTTTAFDPNPKTVSLGAGPSIVVRWVNADITGGPYDYGGTATAHNITSDTGAFPASGSLGGNATYSATLTATGDYPYHCTVHPNMTGTVTVGQ